WHLASVKSLCPLGQPEKALGHEPQIDPWLTRTTAGLAQFQRLIGVVATNKDAAAEMEQLQEPKDKGARQHNRASRIADRGWKARKVPLFRSREEYFP